MEAEICGCYTIAVPLSWSYDRDPAWCTRHATRGPTQRPGAGRSSRASDRRRRGTTGATPSHRPRRSKGVPIAVAAAILIATAALVVGIVNLVRPAKTVTPTAPTAVPTAATPTPGQDTTAGDHALCTAIAPLMRENDRISKAYSIWSSRIPCVMQRSRISSAKPRTGLDRFSPSSIATQLRSILSAFASAVHRRQRF